MINYSVTCRLWLSCESYYNEGYTSDQIKKVIENLTDFDGRYFYPVPMGINGNWIIETRSNKPYHHVQIVQAIENQLEYQEPEEN